MTLSQELYEKHKDTDICKSRMIILELKKEIIEALKDKWPKSKIWQILNETGRYPYSCDSFRTQCNKLGIF